MVYTGKHLTGCQAEVSERVFLVISLSLSDERQDFLEEIQRLKKLRGKTIRVSRRAAGFWAQLAGPAAAKPAPTDEEAKPVEEEKK